jgi:hypothetical protein
VSDPLPFDVAASTIATGRLLERAAARAMENDGLAWDEFITLAEIHDHRGGTHGGAIARRLALRAQTVHRYIQRFEGRGLVAGAAGHVGGQAAHHRRGRPGCSTSDRRPRDVFDAVRRVPSAERHRDRERVDPARATGRFLAPGVVGAVCAADPVGPR